MPRRRNRRDALAEREREFAEAVIPFLRRIADGRDALGLFDREVNPLGLPTGALNDQLNALRTQARAIVELRGHVGVDSGASLASLFLDGLARLHRPPETHVPTAGAIARAILHAWPSAPDDSSA